MYKTKMVKVCLSSFSLCIFSLLINLVVLDMATLRAIAEDSASELDRDKAANTVKTTLEPEILSEINRVRTNPQAYAQWLEAQRRYYDGIWLKLPGEKPIRTNRGLKALEEAIAVLKTQQPLSPLNISEQTAATATSKLENFATANNIQNISYGRVTAKGIVMGIVVDDLFPDRRRRNSLLSSEAANTGVVCKPDPRYAKVCAIAYSDTPVDVAEAQPTTTTTRDTENTTSVEQPATNASQPETTENTTPPEVQVNPTTPETETTASQPETTENPTPPEVQINSTTPETTENTTPSEQSATTNTPNSNDNDAATETLPQPPQTLPGVPDVIPSNSEETVESSPTDNQDSEVAQAEENLPEATNENEDTETATSDSEETTSEDTETANSDSEETNSEDTETANSETEANQDEEDVEVFEAEAGNPESEVATNSDSSRLLENVERGTLETGDRTIPEDGSLYDSYPLEGKAGDSFTIYLESDEFDPFVALIDNKGNIIEQNDDIGDENSNSQIQVTIPQDGVYNVIVNAYDQGGKGNYVLTVRQ
jgi:Bacterial pre-peptidase C-terminal domain